MNLIKFYILFIHQPPPLMCHFNVPLSFWIELSFKLTEIFPEKHAPSDQYIGFYRAMLCIRGTSHGPVSVCLSQVGVLLKRLNVGSHKQYHTIARESSFRMPKISAKFDRGHPLRGRRMQVGWVKIGYFWPIAGYISKTVQDRHIVSIKVE